MFVHDSDHLINNEVCIFRHSKNDCIVKKYSWLCHTLLPEYLAGPCSLSKLLSFGLPFTYLHSPTNFSLTGQGCTRVFYLMCGFYDAWVSCATLPKTEACSHSFRLSSLSCSIELLSSSQVQVFEHPVSSQTIFPGALLSFHRFYHLLVQHHAQVSLCTCVHNLNLAFCLFWVMLCNVQQIWYYLFGFIMFSVSFSVFVMQLFSHRWIIWLASILIDDYSGDDSFPINNSY